MPAAGHARQGLTRKRGPSPTKLVAVTAEFAHCATGKPGRRVQTRMPESEDLPDKSVQRATRKLVFVQNAFQAAEVFVFLYFLFVLGASNPNIVKRGIFYVRYTQ